MSLAKTKVDKTGFFRHFEGETKIPQPFAFELSIYYLQAASHNHVEKELP
jgi:hypothetical protein